MSLAYSDLRVNTTNDKTGRQAVGIPTFDNTIQDTAPQYEDAWHLRLELKRYGNTILHNAIAYYDGLFLDLDDFAEVTPAWFTDPSTRHLWALATDLHSNGEPYSVAHLADAVCDDALLSDHLRINIEGMAEPIALPVAIQSLRNVETLKVQYSHLVEMELKGVDFEQWMAEYVGPDENGVIVLARLPDVEIQPPKTPAFTKDIALILRDYLTTDQITPNLRKFTRRVETFRAVLIKLVDIAIDLGTWDFPADSRWLGEKLGKSGMSANRNMVKLDQQKLVRYYHGVHTDRVTGKPVRAIDLAPLLHLCPIQGSCLYVTNLPKEQLVTDRNDPDIWARYMGDGPYGDATMGVKYTSAIQYRGRDTVLMSNLTHSALTVLDDLCHNTEGTRREIAERKGMTAGAVASATRRLEQLGIVDLEWEGPGRPKLYRLIPHWQKRLDAIVPEMKSYGARDRLIIRNGEARIDYLEFQQRSASRDEYGAMEKKKRKIRSGLTKWKVYAGKRGTYRPRARQQEVRL